MTGMVHEDGNEEEFCPWGVLQVDLLSTCCPCVSLSVSSRHCAHVVYQPFCTMCVKERERETGGWGEREKEVPEGDNLWDFHILQHCSTSASHFEMTNPGLRFRCKVRGCIVKGETLRDLFSSLSPFPPCFCIISWPASKGALFPRPHGKLCWRPYILSVTPYLLRIWFQVPCRQGKGHGSNNLPVVSTLSFVSSSCTPLKHTVPLASKGTR